MNAEEAVDWLGLSPFTTALFTDFDGTLSAIVARPEDARPLPGVPETLKRLAAHMLDVTVASGRPVAWIVEQLGLSTTGEADVAGEAGETGAADGLVQAYGLHGLEHWNGQRIELDPLAITWQPAVADAMAAAIAAALPGVEVEDKQFGVTLHWRNASDPAAAHELATELARDLSVPRGLLTRLGKGSVELVPPVGIDKGVVVRRRLEACGARRVAFLGDDASDLVGFAAIDAAVAGTRAAAAPVSGLRIAVAGDDVPSELIERADVVLDAPEEAARLLAELVAHLETAEM
jgi:trehalose 6-phosphate phosphatase